MLHYKDTEGKVLKENILNLLHQYAEELWNKSIKTNYGIYWETIDLSTPDRNKKINETIFIGTPGIILFYLNMYKVTGNSYYIHIAEQAGRAIFHYTRNNHTFSAALYVGRTGVAYVFIKIYEASGNQEFYDWALQIIRELKEKLCQKTLPCDLLNGMAGNIFSLTYIYAVTQEKFLLDIIHQCLYNLIEKTLVSEKGFKWGFHRKNVNSLCGMSHGASGIAYCFLEIGRYFKNDTYFWLAEQGMAYEEQFYDAEKNNWKDLRLPLNDQRAMDAFLNNPDYLTKGNGLDLNQWTHGAAGIGLTRLKAYRIIQKEKYWQEAEKAIQKTIATDIVGSINQNYIYTQGKAGNAELFLEAYQLTQDEKYRDYAALIAQDLVTQFREKGKLPRHNQVNDIEDPIELFLGSTGLAYFLLRYLDPYNTDSILAPVLPTKKFHTDLKSYPLFHASVPDLRKIIYGKYFARTIASLKVGIDSNADIIYQYPVTWDDDKQDVSSLIESINSEINRSQEENKKKCLSEILMYESQIVTMLAENTSYVHIHTAELHQKEKLRRFVNLTETEFSALKIKRCDHSIIKELCWNWDKESIYLENLNIPPGEYTILLKKKIQQVQEICLNPLSSFILKSLNSNLTVQELAGKTYNTIQNENLVEVISPKEDEEWQNEIRRQIRLLLEAGILEIY